MCGRVVIIRNSEDLVKIAKMRRLKRDIKNGVYFKSSYNISPSNYVMCLYLNEENELEIEAMKWGMVVQHLNSLMFNSRDDTVEVYSMYSKMKRCVLVANGYYEWKDKNSPFYITNNEKTLFIAGLFQQCFDDLGLDHKEMTVITRDARKEISFIHERMPILLKDIDQVTEYLKGGSISKYIQDETQLIFYQVGDLVNKLSNEGEDNILPKEKIGYNKNRNLLIGNFLTKNQSTENNTALSNKILPPKKMNKLDALDFTAPKPSDNLSLSLSTKTQTRNEEAKKKTKEGKKKAIEVKNAKGIPTKKPYPSIKAFFS